MKYCKYCGSKLDSCYDEGERHYTPCAHTAVVAYRADGSMEIYISPNIKVGWDDPVYVIKDEAKVPDDIQ